MIRIFVCAQQRSESIEQHWYIPICFLAALEMMYRFSWLDNRTALWYHCHTVEIFPTVLVVHCNSTVDPASTSVCLVSISQWTGSIGKRTSWSNRFEMSELLTMNLKRHHRRDLSDRIILDPADIVSCVMRRYASNQGMIVQCCSELGQFCSVLPPSKTSIRWHGCYSTW